MEEIKITEEIRTLYESFLQMEVDEIAFTFVKAKDDIKRGLLQLAILEDRRSIVLQKFRAANMLLHERRQRRFLKRYSIREMQKAEVLGILEEFFEMSCREKELIEKEGKRLKKYFN